MDTEKKNSPTLDLSSCTQAVLAPGVLKAFGATHTSIGGAFSEIIDNFVDAGASYVHIYLERPQRPTPKDDKLPGICTDKELLVISGDGVGCDARESLMVGKSEKNLAQSSTIGGYGLGGQSSLMFLAEDALVISLQAGGRVTVSLMSTTMHTEQGITNQLLTPHFDWRLEDDAADRNGDEDNTNSSHDSSEEPMDLSGEKKNNLEAIYRYSPCSDWNKLHNEMLRVKQNKTKTGFRVLLYNLKNMNTKEDEDDILGVSEETDRSLRHVLAYKYLAPKLSITLQNKRILPVFWEGLLVKAARVSFSMGTKKVTVLMGFNPSRRVGQRQHQLHSWLCVYVLGRLIRVYELRSELRIQSKSSMYGSGLCCIVDDVQGYLPLGMNKESVKAGQEYSALKDKVAQYVKSFYKYCKGKNTITHLNETLERVNIPIPFQVHDDKATRKDVIDYKPADSTGLNLYTFSALNGLVPEDPSRPVDCFDFPLDPTQPVPSSMGRNLFKGIEIRNQPIIDIEQVQHAPISQSQFDDDDPEDTQQCSRNTDEPQVALNSLPNFPQRWSKRPGASDVNYSGMTEERQGSKSIRKVQDPYGKIRKKILELFKSQPKNSCAKGFYHQKIELNKKVKAATTSQDLAELIAEYETLIVNDVKTKLWLGEEYVVRLRNRGFCMGITRDEWYKKLFAIDADLEKCVEDFLYYCTSEEFVKQRDFQERNQKSTRELAQATLAHLQGLGQQRSALSNGASATGSSHPDMPSRAPPPTFDAPSIPQSPLSAAALGKQSPSPDVEKRKGFKRIKNEKNNPCSRLERKDIGFHIPTTARVMREKRSAVVLDLTEEQAEPKPKQDDLKPLPPATSNKRTRPNEKNDLKSASPHAPKKRVKEESLSLEEQLQLYNEWNEVGGDATQTRLQEPKSEVRVEQETIRYVF